jgi:type VI secretion system secreted protein VgrG
MADPIFQLQAGSNAALKFLGLEGTEEISRLFDYSLVALAKPTDAVVFADLLGKPAQVTVAPPGGAKRYYHGLISACSFEGSSGSNVSYRFSVKPWLWLLARGTNVRIFQKITVPDILKKVFNEYGGQVEFNLTGSFRKREYCVQYRESDFNFVSRLMEEEGIFYFFKHAAGKHTLVVGNAPSVFVALQGLPKLPFRDTAGAESAVRRWRWSEQIQTTKFTVRDHSFLAPAQTYEKSSTVTRSHAMSSLAAYDYPAGLPPYPDESAVGPLGSEAEAIAKMRIEELQSRYALADGESNSTNVCCGARLKLDDHPVGAQNVEHVVLSTRISMRMSGWEAGASADTQHQCTFTAFAASVPFRPARITPKPIVAGPQTATVVGPAGEDIFVDKYGRVKVQFHWDREGKKDAASSCFIRVAQPSAGKGFGMVFLPRIGQEVVVDFLEGDPDQPLITGRVYNADQMPPYALPKEKTVSTIRSRSSGQGAAVADHNELRFDDLKGSEYLLMHAQKNQLAFVKETTKSLVGKDEHHTVKNDRKEKVEGESHLTVTKDLKQKIDGKHNTTVKGDILVKSDGLYSLKTAQDITAQSGAAISMKSTGDLHLKIGANIGAVAAQNVHIKGGMNIVIEGGMQISIKAGGASVVLGPDGVSITGTMVKINSGGSPGSGGGASPVAPTDPQAPTAPDLPEDPLA